MSGNGTLKAKFYTNYPKFFDAVASGVYITNW